LEADIKGFFDLCELSHKSNYANWSIM